MSDKKEKEVEEIVDDAEAPEEKAPPASSEPAPAQAAPAQAAPAPQTAPVAETPAQPQAPVQSTGASGVYKFNPDEPANPVEVEEPGEGVAPAAATAVALTPAEEAQKRAQHYDDFANDLKYGKITPKTYADLFAEKSTLGKIGTLFGLMLAGIGSGITGQPNSVLSMMDRQIERDVEAQKQNQANKQNWYSMALEHERNQPENMAKMAEASKAFSEAEFADWNNTKAGVDRMVAHNDAINYATLAVIQSQQDAINKMPAGPQKDAYQNQLTNVLMPAAMARITQRNQETAEKKKAIEIINPIPAKKPNPPPSKGVADPNKDYSAVDEPRLNSMIQMGQFTGKDIVDPKTGKFIAIAPQMRDPVLKEKALLEQNRQNLALVNQISHALSDLPKAGQTPGVKELVSSLGTAAGTIAGAAGSGGLGGVMAAGLSNMVSRNAGEKIQDWVDRNRGIKIQELKNILGPGVDVESMLPSWQDVQNPERMAAIHKSMMDYFKTREAERAPNLRRYYLMYDIPNYSWSGSAKTKEKSMGPKEETKKEAPKTKAGSTGQILPSKFYEQGPEGFNPFEQ